MSPSADAQQAIAITHIQVRSDRVACDVRIDPRYAMTTTALAKHAVAAHPDLPRHACVNSEGSSFGAVMDHTPLSHLLEHLVIDILTNTTSDPEAVFVGTSEWTDKQHGIARVEVSYRDDLETLSAFNEAVRFINGEVIRCHQHI
jgi:hypothetical protein